MTAIDQHQFCLVLPTNMEIRIYSIRSDSWESRSMECDYKHDLPMCYDQASNNILFVNRNNREPSLKYLNIKSGLFNHAHEINWANANMDISTHSSSIHSSKHIIVEYVIPTIQTKHIFVSKPAQHFEFSNDYQSLKRVYDFTTHSTNPMQDMISPHVIYVESKQIIVLIGGCDEWPTKFVGIWVYSLMSKEWTKLPIKFNICATKAVLASDGSIIIIGGYKANKSGDGSCIDDIYVLQINDDLNKSVLQKSLKRAPCKEMECNIAITGGYKDELLVTGYVKVLFETTGFSTMDIPPAYLIKIIEEYFNLETIHYVSKLGEHSEIAVKYIIKSLE